MSENHKITVITPVYNAAQYLVPCVDSLMQQTLSEGVEYLFIDDCSTDSSLQVLNEALARYPDRRADIRVLQNSQNLGVTQTRKRGIVEAKGEYIAWVDSDDWIELDMLERFYAATRHGEVDVVVQNVLIHHIHDTEEFLEEWELAAATSPQEALTHYYNEKHVPWGLPFQMSRKRLLQEASAKVSEVNITEDAIMLVYLFSMAKSAAWLEHAYYHYRLIQNSNSLTHRNYKTPEEWKLQVVNIDKVTRYLSSIQTHNEYALTIHYIQWKWKELFREAFSSSWVFWNTYRQSYWDILKFKPAKGLKSVYIWLKYNLYIVYWWREGRLKF